MSDFSLVADCAEPVTDIRQDDYIAEVNVVEHQGPPGPSGDISIGSKPIVISGLAVNDLLRYSGQAWTNAPQVDVTDGGNF